MYVGMWALRSFSDRAEQGYPSWLCDRVHISVNVPCRVAAKLTVHSAINVTIWPFSILSLILIVGVWLLHERIFVKEFEEAGADGHWDAHDDAFTHTCNKRNI